MKVIVNAHKIQLIQEEAVNEKEINVSECEFQFTDEITDNFVKEAYFTLGESTYKKIIVNNKCSFPQEVLVNEGTVELGVVAYYVENEEELIRYNPTPVYFKTDLGSLKEAENSQEPTPSEMEQYEQALQDGLSEVNDKLDAMDNALYYVDNLDIDANKVGTTTTITITDKYGDTKEVQVLDGEKGETGASGKDGANGRDGYIQYNSGNKLNADYVDDSQSTNKFTTQSEKAVWNNKQDTLVSGTNIKTINNQSILGDGNITIEGGGGTGTTDYSNLSNKPSINNVTLVGNKSLSDLSIQRVIDSSHKLSSDLVDDTNKTNKFVTSAEKSTWNNKSNFSGSYNDLTNKPTIPTQVTETTVANWGFTKNTGTYSKPTEGIPSSDLDSSVQISLGKADTAIQSHQDISGKQDKIHIETPAQTTISIEPNKYYSFGEVASLNITLTTPTDNTVYNEYMFEFDSGSTATTLTLPNTIKWLETPTIQANKTYQCSIVNNIGVLLGV